MLRLLVGHRSSSLVERAVERISRSLSCLRLVTRSSLGSFFVLDWRIHWRNHSLRHNKIYDLAGKRFISRSILPAFGRGKPIPRFFHF